MQSTADISRHRIIIIIIIITTTMFMVLSSRHSHCESSPGSFDECRLSAGWPPTLRPNQPIRAVSPPKDWLPPSADDTIAIYYYYSARKLILILLSHWSVTATVEQPTRTMPICWITQCIATKLHGSATVLQSAKHISEVFNGHCLH